MERTFPPSQAYYEIAEFLGDGYLLRPTPLVGDLVSVAHAEGTVTRWHVSKATSKELRMFVWNHPQLAEVGCCGYDQRASLHPSQRVIDWRDG